MLDFSIHSSWAVFRRKLATGGPWWENPKIDGAYPAKQWKRFLKNLSLIWNCKIDQFHALFSVYASFQLFKNWSDGRIASTWAMKRQLPSFIIHKKIHKNLHCLAGPEETRTVNFWILPKSRFSKYHFSALSRNFWFFSSRNVRIRPNLASKVENFRKIDRKIF